MKIYECKYLNKYRKSTKFVKIYLCEKYMKKNKNYKLSKDRKKNKN